MSSYSDAFDNNAQYQDILANSIENLDRTQLETLSLIFEDDHFHMILESMKEVKAGQIVSFQNAFSDLD